MTNLRLLVFVLFTSLACGGVATSGDTAALAPSGSAPAASKPAVKPVAKPQKVVDKPATGVADETGEIEVATAAAVTVQVDGSNVVFDPIKGAYVKKRLAPGKHTVEVFNAIGKEVAEETIDVVAGERVKYRYKNGGRMESFGSFPID